MDDLDKASIRRFTHKIGFEYLSPEGNVIFYGKMLGPIVNTRLTRKQKISLHAIEYLTPGDFKTVETNHKKSWKN